MMRPFPIIVSNNQSMSLVNKTAGISPGKKNPTPSHHLKTFKCKKKKIIQAQYRCCWCKNDKAANETKQKPAWRPKWKGAQF